MLRFTLCFSAAYALAPAQDDLSNLSTMVRQKYAVRADSHAKVNQEQMLAIDAGLEWLHKHQDADGRWNCDGFMQHDAEDPRCDGPGNATHDVGVTGLAVLAYLASNHTLRSGAYSETVTKAVRWLKSQQAGNGRIGSNAPHDFLYDHAIATLAIVEAYGVSADKSLRSTAQKALDYIEFHRNPKKVWRYQPRDGDSDISLTTWCMSAYAAGSDFNLTINESALPLIANYVDQVTDDRGHHGYTSKTEASARKHQPNRKIQHGELFPVELCETTTAVGLACRFILGRSPATDPLMTAAADLLAKKPPTWDEAGSIDYYYWYYGSNAMFQMGGKQWHTWSQAVRSALLPEQRSDGNFAGSWDPISVWGEDGGRVYVTAASVLALQAEFRYARTADMLPLPDVAMFRSANADWLAMRYAKFASRLKGASRKKNLTAQQHAAIIEATAIQTAVETRVLDEIQVAEKERAFLTASGRLEQIATQFVRLAPGLAASKLLSEWQRDPVVKRELAAIKRFEAIKKKAKPGASGQRKLKLALVKFIKKYGETRAAEAARILVASIR